MKIIDVFKKISWKIKYDTGDMPYPPVIFWKNNIKSLDIISAWKNTISYINKSKKKHNMWLYVHIPFCYTRCFYCTCVTKTSHNELEYDEYLDLIELECKKFSKTFKSIKFNTIYVWWGTPTILTTKQIDRFYNILKKYFDLSEVVQMMTEWSPYTTTEEKLKILVKHWVKKMTFWVQSLDSEVLKLNNRPQETNYVIDIVKKAKELWIKYINIDVMAWIPWQDIKGFEKTIKLVEEKIKPDTVHINAFWPTRRTSFIKSWWFYSEDDIVLRNKLRSIGHSLEEKSHWDSDDEADNIQLFNAKNYNSSILWIWLWAISHAFWSLHYAKESMDKYKDWLYEWDDIDVNWYFLNLEDEQVTYIINNFRNWVYFDKFFILFNLKLENTLLYKKVLELEKNWLIIINSNEFWKYFKSKINSEVFCDIYSKFFYSDLLIKDFIKKFNINWKEFSNIDFKLKQFYAD